MTENSAYGSDLFLLAAIIVPCDRFYARQEQQQQQGRRLKALLIFRDANAEGVHYGVAEPQSLCSQTEEGVNDLSA